jgi:fluoroquinolone resistance protein
MYMRSFEDLNYSDKNFQNESLEGNRFLDCSFRDCDFSNCSLTTTEFVSCSFDSCNMSNASIAETAFKDVSFLACKLVGLDFNGCNPFMLKMHFDRCQLHMANFSGLSLERTSFLSCSLLDTDFSGANLTEVLFDNCDMERAIFKFSTLAKANFITSYNYIIDPEETPVYKAKFSLHGLAGLLHKYNIIVEE